jgi:hypothetical protein
MGGSGVKLIKAFVANAEPIDGKVDLWHVDLTFKDALPDETVEIALADFPMTGMRVVNAIATTREAALTIAGSLLLKTGDALNVLCFAPNEIIRLENKQ